ncbi:MAG: hypothetical protein AAF532_17280 [Planctomycetota bacterium]
MAENETARAEKLTVAEVKAYARDAAEKARLEREARALGKRLDLLKPRLRKYLLELGPKTSRVLGGFTIRRVFRAGRVNWGDEFLKLDPEKHARLKINCPQAESIVVDPPADAEASDS